MSNPEIDELEKEIMRGNDSIKELIDFLLVDPEFLKELLDK